MSKHTKGPWKASDERTYWLIRSPYYTYGLAQTLCHNMFWNEHAANAHLMAASPSMFDMCKRLDAFFGSAFGVIPRNFPHAQEAQALWDDTRRLITRLEKIQ